MGFSPYSEFLCTANTFLWSQVMHHDQIDLTVSRTRAPRQQQTHWVHGVTIAPEPAVLKAGKCGDGVKRVQQLASARACFRRRHRSDLCKRGCILVFCTHWSSRTPPLLVLLCMWPILDCIPDALRGEYSQS